MASNASPLGATPSNFYLRNPIALLVSKQSLKDNTDSDVIQTQLKLSTESASKSSEATGGSDSKEVDTPSFILNDTPAKQLVTELATLLDASQLKKCEESDGEGGTTSASAVTTSNGAKRHTPYQILYSNTFQCYTSLAFYGALLAQLKAWVKQLDAGSARSRSLVWAHLFCLVGRDQTSSDPITPMLHAIVSAPKMDLMDVELLYLAILLATKLYPQLLSSASTTPTAATPEPSSASLASSTATSGTASATVSSTGAETVSGGADAASTASDKSSAMLVDSTETERGSLAGETASTPTSTVTNATPSLSGSILSGSKSSAFSATGPAALANPHSKESVQANSVAFYQHYRSRVTMAHEKLIAQVSAQRQRLVMAGSGLLASTSAAAAAAAASVSVPSQNDLILALALRHLAALNAWSAKLEKLTKAEFASVASAVQTVPALRNALAAESSSTSPPPSSLQASGNVAAPSNLTTSMTTQNGDATPAEASSTPTATATTSSSNSAGATTDDAAKSSLTATNDSSSAQASAPGAASSSSPTSTNGKDVSASSEISKDVAKSAEILNASAHNASSSSASPSTPSPFVALLQLWNSAPRKHLASISALYNAICMLKDFDVFNHADFVSVKLADDSTSSPTASNALSNPFASLLAAGVSPSAAAAAAAAVAAASNPMASPLTAAWGSSPLPAWSPVPSPLTTFPGPYGTLSPLTFVSRGSPLAGINAPGGAGSSNTTFSNILPQGTLVRPSATPLNFAGLSGSEPSSGISILGGRSAFGALKRAAEEEAENDIAPKRAKLAEH